MRSTMARKHAQIASSRGAEKAAGSHTRDRSGPHADITKLQASVGNRAVAQWLDAGQPLDLKTRTRMEARLGEDLGGVRLHTGDAAARSAEVLNANAYTVGEHIVFSRAQYRPERTEGQRLLAHEMAHVIQQRRSGTVPGISEPGDAAEIAAETVAGTLLGVPAAHRGRPPGTGGPVPAVQRGAVEDASGATAAQDDLAEKDAEAADRVYQDYFAAGEWIPDLIQHSTDLAALFQGTPMEMRLTRSAISVVMMVIYDKLKNLEKNAQRDPDDGALLMRNIPVQIPWTDGRPKRVEGIPVFSKMFVYELTSGLGPLGIIREGAEYEVAKRILEDERPEPIAEPVDEKEEDGAATDETISEPPTVDEPEVKPSKPISLGSVSLDSVEASTLVAANADYFKQVGTVGVTFDNKLHTGVEFAYKLPQWEGSKTKMNFLLELGTPPLVKPKWKTGSVSLGVMRLGIGLSATPEEKPDLMARFAIDPLKVEQALGSAGRFRAKLSGSIDQRGELEGKVEVGFGGKWKTVEVFLLGVVSHTYEIGEQKKGAQPFFGGKFGFIFDIPARKK